MDYFFKSIDIKKNFKYTNIKQHSTLTEKKCGKDKKINKNIIHQHVKQI